MKLLTEYLDRAISLEHLATDETDPMFKAQLLSHMAYQKLAAARAEQDGLSPPSPPAT